MFTRYVAIGDSSTEGLDDPDGRGGYRGWANRLAANVASAQSAPAALRYANLAIRGLQYAPNPGDEQLEPALATCARISWTLFTGVNDVTSRRFDADAVGRDAEHMQRTLIENGVTVIGFTLPDLSLVMPITRLFSGRVSALNDALRRASASSGAILVDVAKHSIGSDPRLWSVDSLHANSVGHEFALSLRSRGGLVSRARMRFLVASAADALVAIVGREHTRRIPGGSAITSYRGFGDTRAGVRRATMRGLEAGAQPHESRSLT